MQYFIEKQMSNDRENNVENIYKLLKHLKTHVVLSSEIQKRN